MYNPETASRIVQDIKAFPTTAIAFNQYVSYTPAAEGSDAPLKRSQNLERYIRAMASIKGRDLWLFEAPSRRGAVRTGIPQTSVDLLKTRAKQLGIDEGFEAIRFYKAEKAESSDTSRRVAGFFDRMDTKPLIWNAVMIHTRTPDGENRTPQLTELRDHQLILRAICDLCEPSRLFACGRTAQKTVGLLGVKHECVAHPVARRSPSFKASMSRIYSDPDLS
ncbi:hypothetical protein [Mesorhizobium sp.]|uniref:hypothetical protein n=1 Tax=Mesorhizobium sp. TaxID=1871066 RepID=UPI000FE51377|nr:hypothetical protein [Mesorhizobium sp.]RWQ64043.1 MAG: hypothetical protein EOS86_21920 [Mesorhizobium sp.]